MYLPQIKNQYSSNPSLPDNVFGYLTYLKGVQKSGREVHLLKQEIDLLMASAKGSLLLSWVSFISGLW